jgi:phosphoribosylformylglycinamidine synthase
MGAIKRVHALKKTIPPGARIVQIGGPALRIGLGGGAASSMATGSNIAELDYDSVQRDNAEMQRRCQEVIDACAALGDRNPILSIHDIGAGGLSNGCPELVAETGGRFWLRNIRNEDISMSPMEIWCCEAQERYVLAVMPDSLDLFLGLCERERCPAAVIGEATGDGHLSLEDAHFHNKPIDIDMRVILGRPPRMLREIATPAETHPALDLRGIGLREAAERVLRLPAVSNKTFLVTIADRSVTGLVARDQMVGPYQAPLSDVAVSAVSYRSFHGEAMAMGERTPLALVSAPASGRVAVGEAVTNLMAASIGPIGNVKLSANWMCACGEEGEDAKLYETVRAVGMDLCPRLGVSIPVGKDSLSMRTLWRTSRGESKKMTAPLSLIVSAFAPVEDIRRTVTPDLKAGESSLILLDPSGGRNRLGGSALAQVYGQVGSDAPDLDDPEGFVRFFDAVQEMIRGGLLLAYHDRSDGGLFVTLAEMAIGGRRGLNVRLNGMGAEPLRVLFAEELGAVIQVERDRMADVRGVLETHGIAGISRVLGEPSDDRRLRLTLQEREIYSERISILNRMWSELTFHMQAMRDNPECAGEEYDNFLDEEDPGMTFRPAFSPAPARRSPSVRPRMAILREQGINGQLEMAAAFDRAGFECVDLHMTDLLAGRARLDEFVGLAACGGFSYGDVLGAGSGWAGSVLFNEELKDMFRRFFGRKDTFSLGVCNGCQMFSQLKEIIPGAGAWPAFVRNKSEQFEARYVTAEVLPSPSVLLRGMEGSRLPVPVAHGEGKVSFERTGSLDEILKRSLLAIRYVDNYGRPTERYPFNPNGSVLGMTGLTTADGRVTILMPHPERLFRSAQMSYRPRGMFEGEDGPWLRLFANAREFVD